MVSAKPRASHKKPSSHKKPAVSSRKPVASRKKPVASRKSRKPPATALAATGDAGAPVVSPPVAPVAAPETPDADKDKTDPDAPKPETEPKHTWRNRLFIYFLILLIGMLIANAIMGKGGSSAVDSGNTNNTGAGTAGAVAVVSTASTPKTFVIDIVMLLVCILVLIWGLTSRLQFWESKDFRDLRKQFMSPEERAKFEQEERRRYMFEEPEARHGSDFVEQHRIAEPHNR